MKSNNISIIIIRQNVEESVARALQGSGELGWLVGVAIPEEPEATPVSDIHSQIHAPLRLKLSLHCHPPEKPFLRAH
jgi:hypothetical protein